MNDKRDQRVGEEPGTGQVLAEVWGDTVELGHLVKALLIGVPISAGNYLVASRLLAGNGVAEQMAHAWALLVGLAGCLCGGGICALLFKPKRVISEGALDSDARREAIEILANEPGGLGRIGDLPGPVLEEMEQLGLRASFEAAERRQEGST
jgi:hypothetical protein